MNNRKVKQLRMCKKAAEKMKKISMLLGHSVHKPNPAKRLQSSLAAGCSEAKASHLCSLWWGIFTGPRTVWRGCSKSLERCEQRVWLEASTRTGTLFQNLMLKETQKRKEEVGESTAIISNGSRHSFLRKMMRGPFLFWTRSHHSARSRLDTRITWESWNFPVPSFCISLLALAQMKVVS